MKFLVSLILSIGLCIPLQTKSAETYEFITMADIHVGTSHPMDTAPPGENLFNDLNADTFGYLLNQMQQIIASESLRPKMIVVLGDLISHIESGFLGSSQGRARQLAFCFQKLLQLGKRTGIPLTYLFGNNDSLSGNYEKFYTENNIPHSPYDIAKDNNWKTGFLSTDSLCKTNSVYPCFISASANRKEGYYSEYLTSHLKFIGLNTVLFDNHNSCETSCKEELNWLHQELQDAHETHDSVLIAMHIPVGINKVKNTLFWNQDAQEQFLKILSPYAEDIIGLLVAHTHLEEINWIKFDGAPLIPVLYTAGLSTSHGNSPAFKHLTLEREAPSKPWLLKDYTTYYYLRGAFQRLYTFQDTYCPDDKTPSVAACLQTIIIQNRWSDLAEKLNHYYTAGNPNFEKPLPSTDASHLVITPG